MFNHFLDFYLRHLLNSLLKFIDYILFYFHVRYDEMMKERLARRRERLKQGLPVDDDEDEDALLAEFEAEEGEGGNVDAKALLEDMQKR